METRQRLLDALEAIAVAKPSISYETAFKFLMQYVPGSNGDFDTDLLNAFRTADQAIRKGAIN